MTQDELSLARKTKDEAELIKYIPCGDAWFIGDFGGKLGRIRIAVPEPVKNKIMTILMEGLYDKLEEMQGVEPEEKSDNPLVHTWAEAVAANERKQIASR